MVVVRFAMAADMRMDSCAPAAIVPGGYVRVDQQGRHRAELQGQAKPDGHESPCQSHRGHLTGKTDVRALLMAHQIGGRK